MRITSGVMSVTFATAKTATIDFGTYMDKCIVWVPTLATDNYLTVSVSYDGTTYLTLNRIEGADNQTDVIINSARCQVLELGGARYLKFTAPATNQTCTVKAQAIR